MYTHKRTRTRDDRLRKWLRYSDHEKTWWERGFRDSITQEPRNPWHCPSCAVAYYLGYSYLRDSSEEPE